MKHLYILLALLFVGLSSCKDEEEISGGTYVPEGYSGLTLRVATAEKTAGTKAVGDTLKNTLTDEEKKINSLAFFVSLPDGQPFQRFFSTDEALSTNGFYEPLREVGANSGEYTANIRVRGKNFGECEIFVIANYAENGLTDQLKAITKLSDLKNFKVAITDNAHNPLLMYNYQKQTLTNKETKEVGFSMTRLVARIDIRNLASNAVTPENGFVLESARLVNAKKEAFVTATHTADEINLLPVDDTKTFATRTPETGTANIDTLYTYENANTTSATATALELIGTFRGIRAVKHVAFRRVKPDGTTYETVAIERNKRYVVEITPDKDSTDVKLTIKVVDWQKADTIKVEPNKAAPEFKNLAGTGATFTKLMPTDRYQTLDIKSAQLGTAYSFDFDAYSYQEMKYEVRYIGNRVAGDWVTVTESDLKSYADTDKRFSRHYTVAVTPYTGTEKIGTRRALLIVKNQVSGDARDTIQIVQRIDYAAAGLQPVLMKDGKFWAPVNVGATQMPTLTAPSGDLTLMRGQLFQWGRKQGFPANSGVTPDLTTVLPTTQADLEGMEDNPKWKNKLIKSATTPYNSRSHWLLYEANKNNPDNAEMKDAWYQTLWDATAVMNSKKTTAEKRPADPCPVGWRVPTIGDWEAIGAGNTSVIKTWDATNKLLTITGAGSDKLVLPAVGYRTHNSGTTTDHGAVGYYWSSSVPKGNFNANYVLFNSAVVFSEMGSRGNGFSVRCVQED